MVTQLEIARRCHLDVSSVNKILNRRAGAAFRKETVRKVFKTARKLGYDFGRLKFQHRRRFPRKDVSVKAEFYIYHADGALYDQGVATIRDISLGGARVCELALPLASLPIQAFSIGLRPMHGPADGVELRGRIVRIRTDGIISFGIEFAEHDGAAQGKLRQMI
jgi:transcriptional regulator with XRE-family HTH domain